MLSTNPNYLEWLDLLNIYMEKYQINTKRRIACFIGQLAHESMNFTRLEENLRYRATGLRATFPLYFPSIAIANEYALQPEKIANRVYANRMGNGKESSGDGWIYRGRGLIMITGKYNVNEFAKYCEKSLKDTIDYLGTKEGALHSACWYWELKDLNKFSDKMDIVSQTKAINGGLIGYADRLKKINLNLAILK